MNKTNSKIYGVLALVVYIGIMVGFGFILNLFWKITPQNATMFWITTAVVCACVSFYAILTLFGKKDKGVGAMQLFFSGLLSLLPIIVRAINMIPNAGIIISAVLLFIVGATYLIMMIGMGYYATDVTNNSDNRPGGTEI